MKLSPADQQQLVQILTRIYIEVRGIEEEFRLLTGGGDYRPRIEYFHDAIRVFASQEAAPAGGAGGRLSVEFLAYDLSCLRYIHAHPLASIKPAMHSVSPHTQVAPLNQGNLPRAPRPPREVRDRLAELYQQYGVLFAGLLKPAADRDHKDRVDHLDQQVGDIARIEAHLEALSQGKGSAEHMAGAVQHLDEDALRALLQKFMHEQKHKQKQSIATMLQSLKRASADKDKEIAGIESAHLNFAMAQLAIYEESKEMVKKMAVQGMNLVGKFVQDSVAQAQRDMRGRGR